jgi:hypothetical protein
MAFNKILFNQTGERQKKLSMRNIILLKIAVYMIGDTIKNI